MATDVSSHGSGGLCLDILGQQPLLNKLYTQITLCFSRPDGIADEDIIRNLTSGLERLAHSTPWVAGKVERNEGERSCDCDYTMVPWEEAPRLVVKDLRNDSSMPSMEQLRTAHFPMKHLYESQLSPCKTLSFAADMTPYVFIVQVTFITDGLLLTFVAQHNTMDMVGQGEVIRLLSKACRGEQFSREEMANVNASRHNVVPFLDDSWKPGPELDCQTMRPEFGHRPPPPKCTWAYFGFSPDSLASLKSVASKDVTGSSGYVSTDDTLSAYIWQCVTRVRLVRLEPTATSTFARAVDVRQYLGAAPTYTGVLQNMTYNTLSVSDAVSLPLGMMASHLRESLDPETSQMAYRTSGLATVLRRSSDKTKMSFTAAIDPSTDISFSSWAKINLYDLDFNLGLGKPEAVRRPGFDPVESLMYIMPRRSDGELVVGICLRDEDMAGLRADEEFMRYSTYIG